MWISLTLLPRSSQGGGGELAWLGELGTSLLKPLRFSARPSVSPACYPHLEKPPFLLFPPTFLSEEDSPDPFHRWGN